jgi:hypothetical protein
MSILTKEADPLFAQPRAERPAYATGMLLDAQDFSDEQTYHRGRLARAMAFLAGGGTLAGLQIEYVPGSATQVEEIMVNPGLAVDRLGRLIEVPRPICLRLAKWFELLQSRDDGDSLRLAAYDDLGRFVSQRVTDAALALPARAVVADVFIRFVECPVGLTPAFALGPFDALNAVSTSRIRDAWEVQMIARAGLGDSYRGLPLPLVAPALSNSADPKVRRNAAQDAVLGAYGGSAHAGGTGVLDAASEQPEDFDHSAVFLGRVFIPVVVADPADPVVRTVEATQVDNYARRFLPTVSLLAQWSGF